LCALQLGFISITRGAFIDNNIYNMHLDALLGVDNNYHHNINLLKLRQ
jgi:hypothetical protein